MKQYFLILFVSFFIGCEKHNEDNSVVLARVNNQVLTVNTLERLLPAKNRSDTLLRSFIKSWVNNSLLYEAAKQKGFEKDQKLLDARDLYFKQIISNAYLESIVTMSIDISNDEIRQRYEQRKSSFMRQEKQASVVVFSLDTHKEASTIKKQLKKKKSGSERQELIRTYGVQSQLVTKGYLIKELDNAIFTSRAKSITGPIRAQNKYHIIQVLNIYPKGSFLGIEEVYDELYQQLLNEKKIEQTAILMDSLTTTSTVFINSNYQ